MPTRLHTSDFPGRGVVVHIRFTDHSEQFWLVIDTGDPSVCLSDPGYDVDVAITSDLASLYEVWLDRRPLKRARFDRASHLLRVCVFFDTKYSFLYIR